LIIQASESEMATEPRNAKEFLPWSELSVLVRDAIRDFRACDQVLLELEANERSVTHKLAEYLRFHIDRRLEQERPNCPGIAVDCEYNRFGPFGRPKRLPWHRQEVFDDDSVYYTPNPDIIVHHRGDQDVNILAIEVKTHYNAKPAAVLLDRLKLAGYLDYPTYYRYGLFLNFGDGKAGYGLIEAKLAEPARYTPAQDGLRDKLWSRGRGILVDEESDRLSLPFVQPNAEIHAAANAMLGDFDAAYGLAEVTGELSSNDA